MILRAEVCSKEFFLGSLALDWVPSWRFHRYDASVVSPWQMWLSRLSIFPQNFEVLKCTMCQPKTTR